MSELLRLYRNAQIPYEKFIRYCATAPVGILPYYDGLLDQYSEAEQIFVKRVLELEAKYSALTARIAGLEEAQRWIPVSERLPDNWKLVLTIAMSERVRVPVPAFYDPETSLWSTRFTYDLWVTHWMPLPPNPESPNDTQTQTIVYGKEDEE